MRTERGKTIVERGRKFKWTEETRTAIREKGEKEKIVVIARKTFNPRFYPIRKGKRAVGKAGGR